MQQGDSPGEPACSPGYFSFCPTTNRKAVKAANPDESIPDHQWPLRTGQKARPVPIGSPRGSLLR